MGIRAQETNLTIDWDRRQTSVPTLPTRAQAKATERLRQQVADLQSDPLSGTPRVVTFRPGKVRPQVRSSRAAADPYAPVKAFLDQNKDLFGGGSQLLATARVRRDTMGTHDGVRTTVWEQALDDIPVFGASLTANLSREQELLTLCNSLAPRPDVASKRSRPERAAFYRDPPVSAIEAAVMAARHLGEVLSSGDVTEVAPAPRSRTEAWRFRSPKLTRGAQAQLTWLPLSPTELRLCWNVVLTRSLDGKIYRLLIDARSGQIHVRQGLTRDLQPASYRVYMGLASPRESPTPKLPGWPTPAPAQPPNQGPVDLVGFTVLSPQASPLGWVSDGLTETVGNNIDAFIDRNNDADGDDPGEGRAASPSREFFFNANLAQDPALGQSPQAAVVNSFYWGNWMHDVLYDLGFNQNNFQGTDRVVVSVQAGQNLGSFNDRTELTPPHLTLGVFSCPNAGPGRDGAFDAAYLLHEYTHGFIHRRAGDSALESRGLAEGWADFFSLALLSPVERSPSVLAGAYPWGAYSFWQWRGQDCRSTHPVTENYYFGARRFPYSADMTKNPLSLVDLDTARAINHQTAHGHVVPVNAFTSGQYGDDLFPDLFDAQRANEFHNMGEVWCAALWDARMNLIERFTNGYLANTNLLRIVAEGMKYYAPNPTFLNARDGVLLADQQIFQGAHQADLWAAFYKRGLGPQASVTTQPAQGQQIRVLDDFNRADLDLNGRPDLFFEATDTSLQVWSMQWTNRLGAVVSLPSFGGTWRVVGAADIDRDGRVDFFLESNPESSTNVHYLGYRTAQGAIVPLSPSVQGDPAWHIVGAGDFHRETQSGLSYRDTQPDLLWQRDDGTLAVWWMDGPRNYANALLNPNRPGTGWRVVGTGDFDGDGKTDIVFQHTNWQVAFWLMDGKNLRKAVLLRVWSRGWRVVGTGDFDGDKSLDLLLQNGSNVGYWKMNGTNYVSAALIPYPARNLQAVAPR